MRTDRGSGKGQGQVSEILESRWNEGQAHLANAGVELLRALRAAVSIPIDTATLRTPLEEKEGEHSDAAGWRILRDVIDAAVDRLQKLGTDPTQAIRRETLFTLQEALAKEIERLEEGAAGQDVAILAQAFRSVKAIVDRQMELLGSRPRKKTPSSRRARKVKVE